MREIAALVLGLARGEPVILFVQWKSMVRGARAFLRDAGARVLLLDGNLAQRTATLAEFHAAGGVLLLCLEECFAGLHLPHARHVVFAHALVGDRARVQHLERQAVARCVRTGQTEPARVWSFVVADGAEETLWHATRP
jgi:SNF2 family DNA or RNA helicase